MTSLEQLTAWLAVPRETERLEFKEAKSSFEYAKLLNYCAALANEGGGHIVLGVTNEPPRRVVGTKAFPHADKVKADLTSKLRLRVEAHEVAHPDGRVLVFAVPSRPTGRPIEVDGAYWMRSGESLVAMTPDQLQRIFREDMPDFSASICESASLEDLSPACVGRFRELWSQKRGVPLPSSDAQMLADAELVVDGGITYAALVLLGTRKSMGRHLANAEVIFHYRHSEYELRVAQREEFREGFLAFDDALWKLIDQRNTEHSFLDGLFQRSIKTFNEAVVREAVLNAVSHRDYRNQASVMVEQTPLRLRISSPGGFPQGVTAENIWQKSMPRNRLLATAMARCGLVERAGYGADFMFGQLLREGKSPPSYEGTDAHEVVVNLDGRVIDDNFRRFLAEVTSELGRSLQTSELIALEATRREVPVPPLVTSCVPSLIKLGLVERVGRGKLVLGRKYQRLLGTAGDYTRRKGLGVEASVALLEQHLREHEGASLSELCAVLPSFSERQVKALLDGLREEGKAHSLGRTKGTRWYPGPGAKSVAESEE